MEQSKVQRRASPLEIPRILRRIFGNLRTSDLLKLSLVNKCWNRACHCVLRDDKKCVAVIDGDIPCSRATDFNQFLSSLEVIPFNGLSIGIRSHECEPALGIMNIEELYRNLLKMNLKYLGVKWSSQDLVEDCILGQLILRCLAKSSTLEHLNIKEIPMDIRLQNENRAGGKPELPSLKTLELPEENLEQLFMAGFPALLASRAPNIRKLKNSVHLDWIEFLPADKRHIVKRFKFLPNVKVEDEQVLMIMRELSSPNSSQNPALIDEDLNKVCELICSSFGTLKHVELDWGFAVMLNRIGSRMLPFDNVKSLEFQVPGEGNAAFFSSLLRMHLQGIFTSVTSVSFTMTKCVRNQDEFIGLEGDDDEVEAFDWPEVKEVKLNHVDLTDETVTNIGLLFPKLQHFHVYISDATFLPFRQIWSSFSSLRKLTIFGCLKVGWDTNFDAEFCGTHPEETEILQQMSDEFLRAVNIVPPFPPITYLQNLEKFEGLKVETCPASPPEDKQNPSGSLFLSKVTGFLALKRMPKLMELRFRAPFEESTNYLRHLEPFVTLDYTDWFLRFRQRPEVVEQIKVIESLVTACAAAAQDVDGNDNGDGLEEKELDFTGRF